MVNIHLELQRLRASLQSRGFSDGQVESILAKAESEINMKLKEALDSAVDSAVEAGVQKDSADFINDLRPAPGAFQLETESGITDFSTPPYPMLDKLLAHGAKPMSDGSGVYKVIPVGAPSKQPRAKISSNIFDSQKAISAERYENALAQYNKIRPSGSKVEFRTATSKQSRGSQWVLPAKDKDFTSDLKEINNMLAADYDNVVLDIIRNYEESF